ncbi:Septum formation protein Maf [bioreactor metagenome]|uniref:Septum formation protein Maf n=1 Tax=bioreactor metagenome TaxID=1076179 RepID=A0A645A9D2_9ZZZZ
MQRQIILASQSPRRRELMMMCKLPFTDVNPACEEIIRHDIPLNQAIAELAYTKAKAVFDRYPQAAVVGADTIVVLDKEVLGKPKDEEDAVRMLRLLSGKKHQVITGVAVLSEEEETIFFDETLVEFYHLSDEEIFEYVKTREPLDKAGAYGIHARGALFVKKIDGDYYSVMGLPIAPVYKLLQKYL